MRLIESVTAERFKDIVHFLCLFGRDSFSGRAFNKFLALRFEECFVLLSHRGAEDVRLTERKACHIARDLHHLLLIDTHTVGVFERVFKRWMQIFHFLQPILSVYELLHHPAFYGARAIEGRNCGELLKVIGLELHDDSIHTGGSL